MTLQEQIDSEKLLRAAGDSDLQNQIDNLPDSDTQYSAGDGLALSTDNEFSVDLASDPGLQFDGGDLHVGAGQGIERVGGETRVRLASGDPGLQFQSSDNGLHVGVGDGIKEMVERSALD